MVIISFRSLRSVKPNWKGDVEGVMDVEDIILLLEFCLKNTYFSFQGQFYEQVDVAAMGSPVSPIVANLYMEYLEQKALSTAPHPQVLWQVCR